MGYSVANYGSMFEDKWRMDAYISAIKKHINKETVVLDLGAGTGIFSLLACKYGAKKVYAIEPNTCISVGVKAARVNGFSDKIEFFNEPSEQVRLNERVDLIISDLRGILPLLGDNIGTLIDARKRFLKRDGIFIPHSDNIYAAVVNSPKLYKGIVNTWDRNRYKFDLEDSKKVCLNTFYNEDFKSTRLISNRKLWQTINYNEIKHKKFNNSLEFKLKEKSTAHGFSLWFDSVLVPGVKLINSPEVKGAKVYGRAFFPFLKPLDIEKGDRIKVDLSARLVSNEYVWTWNTEHFKKNAKRTYNSFKQSTFYATSLTPEYFLKRAKEYKTSLNDKGILDLEVLKMFSINKNISEIADRIFKKYPKRFKNLNEAIAFTGELSYKYSK